MQLEPSAVKRLALQHGLPVWQPVTLKDADAAARLAAAGVDALIVAAYGLILPRQVLDAVPCALNIHASLLPRWRGAAPIQRAILAGDRESGVCIMRMEEGLDTGPVLASEALPIAPGDDAGSLHDKLAQAGARLVGDVLAHLPHALANAQPQENAQATYAPKIRKSETELRWVRPAVELERAVRAFRPSPGAQCRLGEQTLKVWSASLADGRGAPGEILRIGKEIVVACGEGALGIAELQRAGGKRLAAREYLAGHALRAGMRFGTAG